MELFAGTAGETAAFKRCGFDNSIAVDKVWSHGSLASIIPLDLTKPEDQATVLEWIKHPAVKGVFLAPPCGTASTARQIHLPGENAPMPLRTADEPNGISTLSGRDMLRVSAANILYEFTADVMDLCTLLNKACMVENPQNSLFWITTWWAECESGRQHHIADHQACAYGAQRPKWTRLTANFEQVHTICNTCPGNHTHLPWRVVRSGNKRIFATSLEVHYPKQLCEAIVHAFSLRFVEQGLVFRDQASLQHKAKAATLQQTPVLRPPPLVPAYKSRFVAFSQCEQIVWPSSFPVDAVKKLHEVKFGEMVSVKHGELAEGVCKRISEELQVWHVDFSLESFANMEISFDGLVIFGLQWEPTEFLQKTLDVKHPVDLQEALPAELAKVVDQMFSCSHLEIAKQRLLFFKKRNARAKELQSQEAEMRSNMDPVVETAVQGKRILLFKEMLDFYEYPDKDVVDELQSGTSLVGEVPTTSMLPFKFTPAVTTLESLKLQSKMRRKQIMSEPAVSGDTEIDHEVWQQTLAECERGWLKGPLDEDEVPVTAPI